MSGKLYAVVVALLIFAVAACSSSTSSVTSGVGSYATSLATSPAVAKAKEQATACIQKTGIGGLRTESGRNALVDCVKNVVPPEKRQAFKDCITSAAASDQLWTSEGRSKFMNTSVPDCVNSVG